MPYFRAFEFWWCVFFQAACATDYICLGKIPASINIETKPADPVRYYVNEDCILDEYTLFGRFIHGAWENDLNGAYRDCAKLLAIAVQVIFCTEY